MKRHFTLFLFFCLVRTEIVYESGSMVEFFGGSAPESNYDNWVSHVTEGIARTGYNDFGPEWLDVQTNGFGNYRKLNEGSQALLHWETILSQFVSGDTLGVDSLLQDSLDTFFYELVVFEDTTLNKSFYMLREQIDSSFVDVNQPDETADDVIGGFRNGWGLFIINPSASREQVLFQVPHPCDDFIAPYIALDLFLEIDAFGLMISGSSREAAWSQSGEYTNSKSYSDPSRYKHTVFQKFQEAVAEPLINTNPHWPLVFAVHSFDNASHASRNSIILGAGAGNANTNKPIRDISGDHFDIINFTEEFPIPADQFTNPEPLHVTGYYEANYNYDFYYDNGSEEFLIRESESLNGIPFGHQMVHLQSLVSGYSVYEPWLHVEMDEKPMLFDSSGVSDETVYSQGVYPTGVHNFSMIREYYQPFIQAVDSYLTHWETVPDASYPDSIKSLIVRNAVTAGNVDLLWSPVFDSNFKTYEIQFGQDSITNDSPIADLNNYAALQYMRTSSQTLSDFDHSQRWFFKIRAKDYFNNAGPWSETISNWLPGHGPPDTLLKFDENTIFGSVLDEDSDIGAYTVDTAITMHGANASLALYGNTWKSVQINPFLPDTSSILQIFARVDSVSEIQGIGFSNGMQTVRYSISGTQMLDIENWIPVYQGTGEAGVWKSYEIPIGNDWVAWFDSLSAITEIQFINDNDASEFSGGVHFSLILDLTPDLPKPPIVSIGYSAGEMRIENNHEIVSISFVSTVVDSDSYNFTYEWEFGDGNASSDPNPLHNYLIEDDHDYTVILTVRDESGKRGWASTTVQVSGGASTFPLKMNFVGDIMMGRQFESFGGIIPTLGVNALFEPTLEILGQAADVTVANLEIPLSNQGYAHPTKTIVFRSNPANVGGLLYGGIDVVSLANNHIMDYMEPALTQTQQVLGTAGILYSGAGLDSYEAYLPAMMSRKGQTLAFIASSDRTGQYNNFQPYLNAGENKPGFAYMTPYHLKQQINSVRGAADLVIVEMHAGSEYSYSPGANYDFYEPESGFETMRINPASGTGFGSNTLIGSEEEDYSPRLDRPQMWDRAIRQFAIDEGADAVIVHHPHIIQGVEIYNGKMIAHSLGNFIFDLGYAETYPSMILNAEADETGFRDYSITPVYIDDYIPLPAKGELGNYILDNVAMLSRELDTYVHVNNNTQRATVVLDTLSMERQSLNYSIWDPQWKETEFAGEPYFISNPLAIPDAGSLSEIVGGFQQITHYRLGREKIWMKNFENEGSSLWNLNSQYEELQNDVRRRGRSAVAHTLTPNTPDNIITNLEDRFPFNNAKNHTVHGYIKTENGNDVALQIRLAGSRSSGTLLTASIDGPFPGENDWLYYWGEAPTHEDANFFDIRMNSDIPDTGIAKSWFDDVGLVQWDSIETFDGFPINIQYPNNFNYIQLFATGVPTAMVNVQLTNTIIGGVSTLEAVPRVINPTITAPGRIHFYDESRGPVGKWHWQFLDAINVFQRHPSFYFFNPGIYGVSLTVTGINGESDTDYITVVVRSGEAEEHLLGDVNGDGFFTDMDVVLCVQYILRHIEFDPDEFLAADVDKNGTINIIDVLLVSDY